MRELIHKRQRGAKFFVLDNGLEQAVFGRHIHYVDSNDEWHDIDLTIKTDPATGENIVDAAQVQLETTPNGLLMTEVTSGFGMEWLYGSKPLKATENYLTFSMGGNAWRIYPTPTGIKVESTISNKIGRRTLSIPYILYGAPALQIIDGHLVSPYTFDIPPPVAYGADGEEYTIGTWSLTTTGGNTNAVMSIDDRHLPNAALPYVFDPTTTFSVTVGGDDISTGRRGTSSSTSAMTTIVTPASTTLNAGRFFQSPYYYFYNSAIRWNTSTLPDDALITDAQLQVVLISKTFTATGGGYAIDGEWYTGAFNTGSIDQVFITNTAFSKDLSAFGSVGGTETITLSNPNMFISKTDYTTMLIGQNIGSTSNTEDSTVGFASFENTTYNEPRLIVTYTTDIAVLSDAFQSSSIDTNKWTTPVVSGTTTAYQDDMVRLNVTTTTLNAYASLQSVSTYTITGSQLSFQPIIDGWTQQTGARFFGRLQVDGNNYTEMYIENASLVSRTVVAGTVSNTNTVTYNANTHRLLRFRESGGTLYYEYSVNGISWTALTSHATPAFMSSPLTVVFFNMNVGTPATNNGAVYLDNVNTTALFVTDTTTIDEVETSIGITKTGVNQNITLTDTDTIAITDVANATELAIKVSTDTESIGATDAATKNILVQGLMANDTQTIGSIDTATYQLFTSDTDSILGIDLLATSRPELTVPTIDEIITGVAGTMSYIYGMRYYTDALVLIDDVSTEVFNVGVDWDETRSIKRTVTFDYLPNKYELHHDYYVEPYIIIEIPIKELAEPLQEEYSLGLYTELHHVITIGQSNDTIAYTGHDRLVKLVSKTVNTVLTVPAGASYTTTIRNLCIEAGFADAEVILPISSVTVPSALTWEAGATYYAIVEQLASALNWERPYIDTQNRLNINEMRDLNTTQPDVIYATDEQSIILPDITHTHGAYDVVNHIIISVDDPLRTPFTSTYTNNSVNNPYSYTNTGVMHTRLVEDMDYMASSSIATTRAKYIAQRETAPHTMDLITWVDVRRTQYEIYAVYIESPGNNYDHISSVWRCTAWTMTLANGGTMTHRLKEILEV